MLERRTIWGNPGSSDLVTYDRSKMATTGDASDFGDQMIIKRTSYWIWCKINFVAGGWI